MEHDGTRRPDFTLSFEASTHATRQSTSNCKARRRERYLLQKVAARKAPNLDASEAPSATKASDKELNTMQLLKYLFERVVEFFSAFTTKSVERINELREEQFTVTSETKTACRQLMPMLRGLITYLTDMDNFKQCVEREEQKALDALRQEQPDFGPLNDYLEQLECCLKRAETSFGEFKDRCNDNIMKELSTVHVECESTADKAKLAEDITKGVGGAFSAMAMVAGVGTGGAAVIGIVLSLTAGVPTSGIGTTVIGLAITGTVAPIVCLGVWHSAAGLTQVITTQFKDKKEALIPLGIHIGEIEATALSVQHTAEKLQAELKKLTEQIEYFKSPQASQMKSVVKFIEDLRNFATVISESREELLSKQQDLENRVLKVTKSHGVNS